MSNDLNQCKALLKMLNNSMQSLQNVTGQQADKRTETQGKTILNFHQQFPDAKILVFGGAAHNNDKQLLELLKENGIKYCILTPQSDSKKEIL